MRFKLTIGDNMKKIMQGTLLVVSFSLLLGSTNVSANPAPPSWALPSWAQPHKVPEIDAAGIIPAITILGGLLALIKERKRSK
jgi:hypothetical protein